MPTSNSRSAAQIPSSPRNTARYTNKDGTKVITVSRPSVAASATHPTSPTAHSNPAIAASSNLTATAATPTAAVAPQKPSSAVPSAHHDSVPAHHASDSPMSPASTKKAKKRQAAKSAKAADAASNINVLDAAREMALSVIANSSAASGASAIADSTQHTSAGPSLNGVSPDTGLPNSNQGDAAHSPATTSSDHLPQQTSKKNKKRKKKNKKTASVADSNDPAYLPHSNSHGQDYAANGHSHGHGHGHNHGLAHGHSHNHAHAHNHHHHNHHHQHSLPRDDPVWDIKPHEDRERIKEFWLNLDESERKSLVRLEKETVLKKMKDQQKNTCTCNVCGRKRTAIERELEGLYDSYYRELEQYAQEGNSTPFLTDAASGPHDFSTRRHPPMPGAFPRTPASQSRMIEHVPTDDYDDEDDLEEDAEEDEAGSDDDLEYDDDGLVDPRGQAQRQPDNDLVTFGQSLQVKEGILTVADDLLRNDGKRFIEMMEKLAERRMAREDGTYPSSHAGGDSMRHGYVLPANGVSHAPPVDHDHGFEDSTEPYDDEGDEGDEYEEEDGDGDEEDEEEMDDHQTEEQRMAEGRKMFQIFAARMFEQRVLSAYRKKLSADRSAKLMEELDKEERERQEREAAKAAKQQRKREKERAKKQAAAEAKARKEAEKAAEEAAKKAEKEAQAAKTRAKAEEKRKAKEAQRRAEEEERQRKEAERLHRIHEQERKNKEAKERQNKLREENRLKEKEAREAKEKEKEKKEREFKEKLEAEAAREREKEKEKEREREEKEKQAKTPVVAALASAAAPTPTATPTASASTAATASVSVSATVSASASASMSTAIPTTYPVTPSKPKSAVPATTTPARTPIPAMVKAPSSIANTPSAAITARKLSIPPGLYNSTLPLHGPNPIASAATPMSSMLPPQNGVAPGTQAPLHFGGLPISPATSSTLKGPMPVDQFLAHQPAVTAPPPGLSTSSLPPGLGPYNGRSMQDGMYQRYGSVDGLQAPPGLAMPQMKNFGGPPPGLSQPYESFNSLPIGSNSFGMASDSLQSAFSHGRQSSGSFDLSALGIANGFYHKPAPIGRPGSVAHSNRSNSTSQEDVNEHLGSRALLDDQDDIMPCSAQRPRVGSAAPGLVRPATFTASPFMETSSAFSLGGYSPWSTATTTNTAGFAPPAGIWGSSGSSGTGSLGFQSVNTLPARRKILSPPTLRRYLAAACQTFRDAGQAARDGFVDYAKIKRHIEAQLGHEVNERDLLDVSETLGNTNNGGGSFECRELAPGLRVIRWDPSTGEHTNQHQKPVVREPLDHVIGHGLGRV
ncbi:hypothetical protein TD95_001771 [Thielaviopsis punctulata]|uniref:Stress response protein NST1 n=1 Tax=Thielaviopsis punctulata TaxID=72032 RepID=A0A0F4Z721_9PEZI|nr:hypothetical protein TD95_001771 [Thielaviopsis punctulata]